MCRVVKGVFCFQKTIHADTLNYYLSYLVACTFFAALYNKSPQRLSFPDGLDRETAAFLQGVAWTTANAFYGRITVEKKVAMVATH